MPEQLTKQVSEVPPSADALRMMFVDSTAAYLLMLIAMLGALSLLDVYILPYYMLMFEGVGPLPLATQTLFAYRSWIRVGVLLLFTSLAVISFLIRAPYVHLLRWVVTPILCFLVGAIILGTLWMTPSGINMFAD